MKRPLCLITGDWVNLPSPQDRYKARLARMRHIVWLAVKTMDGDTVKRHGRLVMYTLTYKGVADWEPRHISECVRWLRRQGVLYYVWVAELQKRGAIHYHVLCVLPTGQRWVKPGSGDGGWTHGFTWVTDEIKYPLYIMKYLQKGSKDGRLPKFPKGCRLYAVSRRLVSVMSANHALAYRLTQLPRWFGQGAIDGRIAVSSRRVYGGVSYGRYRAVSPYTLNGLRQVDSVDFKW